MPGGGAGDLGGAGDTRGAGDAGGEWVVGTGGPRGEEWEGKEMRPGTGWKGRGAESVGNPSTQEDGEPENCGAGKGKRSGVAERYGKDGGPGEEGFGKTRMRGLGIRAGNGV